MTWKNSSDEGKITAAKPATHNHSLLRKMRRPPSSSPHHTTMAAFFRWFQLPPTWQMIFHLGETTTIRGPGLFCQNGKPEALFCPRKIVCWWCFVCFFQPFWTFLSLPTAINGCKMLLISIWVFFVWMRDSRMTIVCRLDFYIYYFRFFFNN